MGTPDFSVGTLEALAEAGHEVVLAVTQPAKPKGRGGKGKKRAVTVSAGEGMCCKTRHPGIPASSDQDSRGY